MGGLCPLQDRLVEYFLESRFDIWLHQKLNFCFRSVYARFREDDRTQLYNSRRCAFSSSRITALRQGVIRPSILAFCRQVPHGLFSLLFPDDCRICHQTLTKVSRIPVCEPCLSSVQPLEAEYFCASCRTPFANAFPLDDAGLCNVCRNGLRGFDNVYCYGFYDGVLKDLIYLFKYSRVESLAKPLAAILSAALPRDVVYDAVVPVPLHWRKQLQRGFNQAGLLARRVARQRGMRLSHRLKRTRWTGTLAELNHPERRKAVAGAFSVRGKVEGLRILLVDDVMTTGSTAGACAIELKRAGAKSVTLLTLARVDRRLVALSARTSSTGAS
jgi:ComF family protein